MGGDYPWALPRAMLPCPFGAHSLRAPVTGRAEVEPFQIRESMAAGYGNPVCGRYGARLGCGRFNLAL